MKPHEILQAAAQTNLDKQKEYGDNYLKFGSVFAALFPDGLVSKTFDDHNRLHLLIQIIVKITRYAENFNRGGHQDSLRDLAVYSAMLEAYDAERSVGDRR